MADGWRMFEIRDGHRTRIRLIQTGVQIEIVEGGVPRPFAWDVLANEPLDDNALTEVAEIRGNNLIPLSAEGDESQALRDGQCWLHVDTNGTRTLRAHIPEFLKQTVSPRINLARSGLKIDIDLHNLQAIFSQQEAHAIVRGECVRVLAIFALARENGEGWLDASEAWARWTELGGTRDTSIERMSWERGKLRTQLARQRVTGLETMFTRRKIGAFVELRLTMDPSCIVCR
jgi:hypothetical protein